MLTGEVDLALAYSFVTTEESILPHEPDVHDLPLTYKQTVNVLSEHFYEIDDPE